MLPIDSKVATFYITDDRLLVWGDDILYNHKNYWEAQYTTVSDIRGSSGYPVNTFKKLVELTGQIAIRNRQFDMFFRGQKEDHKDKNSRSIIYPSICRPDKKDDGTYKSCIETSTIVQRFKKLEAFIQFLQGKGRKKNYNEFHYALIQHYEILQTPLIDITQSLRVAATFALQNSKTGYLYVLGLPYPHGSISHYIDLNTVLVKLQNVCPAKACRPRYQEGFLVGRLPFAPSKEVGDNLAKRLIAKFRLDNTKGKFWDDTFNPLPNELLFPVKDMYLTWLRKMYTEFSSKPQARVFN
jgi:hypothetical protein